ncbi:hypothetical protein HK405_006878, partial [Cladochytrium tenue]
DRAPFRAFKIMRHVVQEELGIHDVSERFTKFDETPLAAASLAQVHRAVTADGQDVAVKIQYPDVSRLFVVDTSTMQLVSDVAAWLFPDFALSWVVAEFRSTLLAELDFCREADNADGTAARFAHRAASVRCPTIRRDLSGVRLLTMEFVDGVKVNNVAGLLELGVRPRDVAVLVCDAFAEMVFCHGVVHCDPHPGNMLVVRSPADPTKPQLVLLDHGMYRTLDDRFRKLYCNLWKAMVLQDRALLRHVSEEIGAGEFGEHFPLMFTGRPLGSRNALGTALTPAERARARASMSRVRREDVLAFFENLPRDMLFAVRVGNLVRAIHKDLGGADADRLWINAANAVKGARCAAAADRTDAISAAGADRRWTPRNTSLARPRSLFRDVPADTAARIGLLFDLARAAAVVWFAARVADLLFLLAPYWAVAAEPPFPNSADPRGAAPERPME